MNLLRISVFALITLAVGASAGCASAGAAPGVGVYASGELVTTEVVSLDKAYDATRTALRELEFRLRDQTKDALTARLSADMADTTIVWVKLTNKGGMVTEFRIKVGFLGNEAESRLIMDKIKQSF